MITVPEIKEKGENFTQVTVQDNVVQRGAVFSVSRSWQNNTYGMYREDTALCVWTCLSLEGLVWDLVCQCHYWKRGSFLLRKFFDKCTENPKSK